MGADAHFLIFYKTIIIKSNNCLCQFENLTSNINKNVLFRTGTSYVTIRKFLNKQSCFFYFNFEVVVTCSFHLLIRSLIACQGVTEQRIARQINFCLLNLSLVILFVI